MIDRIIRTSNQGLNTIPTTASNYSFIHAKIFRERFLKKWAPEWSIWCDFCVLSVVIILFFYWQIIIKDYSYRHSKEPHLCCIDACGVFLLNLEDVFCSIWLLRYGYGGSKEPTVSKRTLDCISRINVSLTPHGVEFVSVDIFDSLPFKLIFNVFR